MIAKTTGAPSFFPLAAYLAAGTDGRHPERVDWITGRHIASHDLHVAPAIMEATAYQSARTERPCYHVVVSFDVDDRPTRAEMEEVGDRVLERLGLADHQAVIVAHNDRPHAHIHLMVNRVHPETGLAWERWGDHQLIEAALRDAERALGMREVPGRLARVLDQERSVPAARETSLTWGERRRAERTGEIPLLDRARAALTDCRAATSWHTLDAALAQHSLAVERTQRGIAITDGRTSISASRVAPDWDCHASRHGSASGTPRSHPRHKSSGSQSCCVHSSETRHWSSRRSRRQPSSSTRRQNAPRLPSRCSAHGRCPTNSREIWRPSTRTREPRATHSTPSSGDTASRTGPRYWLSIRSSSAHFEQWIHLARSASSPRAMSLPPAGRHRGSRGAASKRPMRGMQSAAPLWASLHRGRTRPRRNARVWRGAS